MAGRGGQAAFGPEGAQPWHVGTALSGLATTLWPRAGIWRAGRGSRVEASGTACRRMPARSPNASSEHLGNSVAWQLASRMLILGRRAHVPVPVLFGPPIRRAKVLVIHTCMVREGVFLDRLGGARCCCCSITGDMP